MSHQEEMRKAFIADIAANPEDMARRLIFADWLEDNGEDDYALEIRWGVECEADLSEMPNAIMLRKYYPDVISLLVPDGGAIGDTLRVRRGFIEEIHAPLSVLEEHLPALVQEHPLMVVRATDMEPYHHAGEGVHSWWHEVEGPGSEWDLPKEVWVALDEELNRAYAHAKDYPTVERAHAALSAALLKLARSKVASPAAPA